MILPASASIPARARDSSVLPGRVSAMMRGPALLPEISPFGAKPAPNGEISYISYMSRRGNYGRA
jgi:hypothetical protein